MNLRAWFLVALQLLCWTIRRSDPVLHVLHSGEHRTKRRNCCCENWKIAFWVAVSATCDCVLVLCLPLPMGVVDQVIFERYILRTNLEADNVVDARNALVSRCKRDINLWGCLKACKGSLRVQKGHLRLYVETKYGCKLEPSHVMHMAFVHATWHLHEVSAETIREESIVWDARNEMQYK